MPPLVLQVSTLSSPLIFPLRRFFASLLLPFSLLYHRSGPLGDRATNTHGELCLPFVKILDVSLIGTSGGSRAYPGGGRKGGKKKQRDRARTKIREPLTARRTLLQPQGAYDLGRNLFSKRTKLSRGTLSVFIGLLAQRPREMLDRQSRKRYSGLYLCLYCFPQRQLRLGAEGERERKKEREIEPRRILDP